jgi:hypothetical protein
LQEISAVVNRTQAIRQLSSNSASVEVLSMPRVPRLTSTTLNVERDKRFRLKANLPIVLGAGMDLGSNDQVFWFEVPEGVTMTKTLYYAQHEQYRAQLHRAILPVDPTWLMDALGLVQIDPSTVVAGPERRDDGKLEIRSTIQTPSGTYQRVLFIEASAGYVTDQFLYSPSGSLVAKSQATNHVYYDQQQVALPHRVELTLTPASGPPLAMRIDVGSYLVNQLLSNDPQLFTMPTSASQAVDLTQLASQPAVVPVSASLPTSYNATVPAAYPLRGITR